MKTILITGANRGLGRAIAHALDEVEGVRLVLAVRDRDAGEAVARTLRHPARVVRLDTASRAEIEAVVRQWDEPLFGLVNNAGLQQTGGTTWTPEGVETTLAVNHLGPLALTAGLLPWLRGGTVLGIGSGTHNPDNRTATRFGFRGGRFTSIRALALGESEASNPYQAGQDRYATSKLLAMVTTMELARRFPETRFVTLDPGLMPGTGLARTAPWYGQLAWSWLLPALVPWLDDASTPRRSARAARALLIGSEARSGEVYDFRGSPSRRVWAGARDSALASRVLEESLTFLGRAG